jgi:DNA-binding CsgD family transcriptional regulator
VHNLSIVSPRKTAARIRRRPARPSSAQFLQSVLGAAEDAILNSTQTDAILAHLGGVPYRIQLRPLDGMTHVIVAIVDNTPTAVPTVTELRERFGFTEREAEVARLLAARLTNKEIARSLGVTTYTAERHTERILDKLGINSRRHVQEAIAASA